MLRALLEFYFLGLSILRSKNIVYQVSVYFCIIVGILHRFIGLKFSLSQTPFYLQALALAHVRQNIHPCFFLENLVLSNDMAKIKTILRAVSLQIGTPTFSSENIMPEELWFKKDDRPVGQTWTHSVALTCAPTPPSLDQPNCR